MKGPLFTFALLVLGLTAHCQVQIDKAIDLNGSGVNAKITGIKDVSGSTDAVSAGVLQSGSLNYATTGGSSSAYTLALTPAWTSAYIPGMEIRFRAHTANAGGGVTLKINAQAAIPIKKDVGTDLAAGDLQLGQLVTVAYDDVHNIFQLLSRTTDANSGGTVTSVSVTSVNGVSGTVANSTTTPAISLTLGAITPSSVAATGNVTGANLSGTHSGTSSGTNTGDQTITLTGDVGGSGTGSFAATIAANAITSGKILDGAVANSDLATMPANTIKGSITGTGAPIDLTVAQTQTMLGLSNSNTGDVTLSAIGATPNANGASLTGQALNLQPANASFGGVVTTGAQTFAGAKTFTGTVSIPTPFTLGATSVTSTGTQLNYLNAAAGTTGTASTNVVFSTSPLFTTPRLASSSAVGNVWTATDVNGNGSFQALPANVSSFSAGTTGFTPSSAATGAITLAGTLNIANGGTGSATKNFVDLTTAQTAAGAKTWSDPGTFSLGATASGGQFYNSTTGQSQFLLNSSGNWGCIQNDASNVWSLAYGNNATTALKTPVLSWTASTARVGIGTTNPQARLHVVGSSSGTIYPQILIEQLNNHAILDITSTSSTSTTVAKEQGIRFYNNAIHQAEIYTANGDQTLRLYTAGADRLALNSSGVGIGTDPGHPFHVKGTSWDYTPLVYIESTANPSATSPVNGWTQTMDLMMPNIQQGGKNMMAIGKAYASGQTGYMYYYHDVDASASNALRFGFYGADDIVNITAGGFMGIGTNAPAGTLSVVTPDDGPWAFTIANSTYDNTQAKGFRMFQQNDGVTFMRNANKTAITLGNTNGYVGIGTLATTPDAPLQIKGVAMSSPSLLRTYFSQQAGTALINGTSVSGAIQVHANGWFWADGGGFVATSDARIKSIIGKSNAAEDLEKLDKIEITDYKYIDQISNTGMLQKKVIAQQLKSVYPIAVNQNKGVIPNVFETAEKVTVSGKTTLIVTKKPHDFKTGDMVKLILEKTGEKMVEVSVNDAHTFTVAGAIDENVFVYGKNVNDLLNVDYDAVSMLNVSATQELSKKVKALEKENARLAEENCEIKYSKADAGAVEDLRIQLQELKQLMQKNGIRSEK